MKAEELGAMGRSSTMFPHALVHGVRGRGVGNGHGFLCFLFCSFFCSFLCDFLRAHHRVGAR